MDGFTDSLSQHFATPQDMITANAQAEAEEMESLHRQVDKYEGVLDRISEAADSLDKKISEIQPAEGAQKEPHDCAAKLSGIEGKLQEHIHKENVRVYRNVQASFVDELSKQTQGLTELIERIEVKDAQIEERCSKIENKIGALEEKAASNAEELKKAAREAGKGKAVLSMQIVGLVLIVADLAINILKIVGIL